MQGKAHRLGVGWKIRERGNDAVDGFRPSCGTVLVVCTPFPDVQHRNRGLPCPPIEHACLKRPDVVALVQGMDLNARPLAFEQVLKFIRTIRSTGRRPVKFIGISRTGLTTNMVRQIARAIAFLPTNTHADSAPILEMQKVVAQAPCFISPILH